MFFFSSLPLLWLIIFAMFNSTVNHTNRFATAGFTAETLIVTGQTIIVPSAYLTLFASDLHFPNFNCTTTYSDVDSACIAAKRIALCNFAGILVVQEMLYRNIKIRDVPIPKFLPMPMPMPIPMPILQIQ